MGKCILAGHPPVGGQIGYGTYTGKGSGGYAQGEPQTILLGVTPKWVLVVKNGADFDFQDSYGNARIYGGLAIAGFPATVSAGVYAVAIVDGGFQVLETHEDTSIKRKSNTNTNGKVYNYIYGT